MYTRVTWPLVGTMANYHRLNARVCGRVCVPIWLYRHQRYSVLTNMQCHDIVTSLKAVLFREKYCKQTKIQTKKQSPLARLLDFTGNQNE